MPNYYDDWKGKDYTCGKCGWKGKGSELEYGECYSACSGRDCPKCHEELTVVLFPTIQETRDNWDKASEADRAQVESIEGMQAKFERLKLREPSQLPEIKEPSFTLTWDLEFTWWENSFSGPGMSGRDPNTLIKHGETVLFTEPAWYEGYDRFIEVAEIVRARYGEAVRDLVPSDYSELYLWGDKLSSPATVYRARQRIFGSHAAEELSAFAKMWGSPRPPAR